MPAYPLASIRASRRLLARPTVRQALWGYLFVAPFYLTFAVFGLFPIGYSFYLAFTRWTPFRVEWVGLENVGRLLSDPLVHTALLNSLWLMAVVTVVQVGLALLLALVIHQRVVRGRDLYRTVLFLPYLTAPVVLGLVWGVLFAYSGVLNYLLGLLGLAPVDWLGYVTGSGRWIKPAVALVTVWQYVGWNILLFSAGLTAIPAELCEAARLDGAGPWALLRWVIWPLLRRVTFFVVAITVIGSLQIFDIPLMLLGGLAGAGSGTLGGPEAGGLTLSMLLYDTAFNYGQFGYAGAIALLLFATILLVTAGLRQTIFRDSEG